MAPAARWRVIEEYEALLRGEPTEPAREHARRTMLQLVAEPARELL
jgi:hypothetical protein